MEPERQDQPVELFKTEGAFEDLETLLAEEVGLFSHSKDPHEESEVLPGGEVVLPAPCGILQEPNPKLRSGRRGADLGVEISLDEGCGVVVEDAGIGLGKG